MQGRHIGRRRVGKVYRRLRLSAVQDRGVTTTPVFGSSAAAAQANATKGPDHFGSYTPGKGLKVADTEYGDLNIRLFTYFRYLNSKQLSRTYTNAFDQTSDVQQRQDLQVNKVVVYFAGWALSRKLH